MRDEKNVEVLKNNVIYNLCFKVARFKSMGEIIRLDKEANLEYRNAIAADEKLVHDE